jgi:hypothetical protein
MNNDTENFINANTSPYNTHSNKLITVPVKTLQNITLKHLLKEMYEHLVRQAPLGTDSIYFKSAKKKKKRFHLL